MIEPSTAVFLVFIAAIGGLGGVFLLMSLQGGSSLMDRLYGGEIPGKLRPAAERVRDAAPPSN
jgi:hypothetical protein